MGKKGLLDFSNTQLELSYYISFKKGRPELYDHPNLRILGRWEKNGALGYRISSRLTKEKLIDGMVKELKSDENDFHFISFADFWGW